MNPEYIILLFALLILLLVILVELVYCWNKKHRWNCEFGFYYGKKLYNMNLKINELFYNFWTNFIQ